MNDLAALRDAPGEIAAWPDARVRPLLLAADFSGLLSAAAGLRDAGHGNTVSYSRKVFIPLTKLCRDVCRYCTFAETPKAGPAYLSADEVLAIARAGERAGCREALFTLGDRPEARYPAARRALDAMGHESTLSWLAEACALTLRETSLLPHVNPGVMNAAEIAALRKASVSQGLMLESAADRLCERGGPHYGSPDKRPAVRLATIAAAGAARVPFTSGLLIGIGETRAERIDTLLALRRAHHESGHIQEVIVQNFRAKPGTQMADAPEPDLDELLWTIAAARVAFGARANIQAPPNLSAGAWHRLLAAGLNDWGGVSPVTPDHVNPEAPWPHLADLAARTESAGFRLVERLAVYPDWVGEPERWIDAALVPRVVQAADSHGFARIDAWSPGKPGAPDPAYLPQAPALAAVSPAVARLCDRPGDYDAGDIERLFAARGPDYRAVCAAADALRRETVGDRVTYVVNRNINYTNICYFKCRFCAFSKGRLSDGLRGAPYDLAVEEVVRRAREAWRRGATEVCMQGGIHPDYDGDTYITLARAVKAALPDMHVHAFSPLEISQGAETSGRTVPEFLALLRDAGLGTLPGTAAEILDDEVRAVLCPDKIDAGEWLSVMRHAHALGMRSTATIMFGHMETPASWARHLSRLRALQAETGGFTEFVPLPFVHMTAPIYLQGRARKGPTFREAVLMHAVPRLALHPLFVNIQASWVKMGPQGLGACLAAGANDLGGTLMNESISRAAGTEHGQEMPPERMESVILDSGREPWQRTTLYGDAPHDRRVLSRSPAPLAPIAQTPPARRARRIA